MKRKTNQPAPLIAYIRVSTAEQGSSRLGLEAQRDSIRRYAEQSMDSLSICASPSSTSQTSNLGSAAVSVIGLVDVGHHLLFALSMLLDLAQEFLLRSKRACATLADNQVPF